MLYKCFGFTGLSLHPADSGPLALVFFIDLYYRSGISDIRVVVTLLSIMHGTGKVFA